MKSRRYLALEVLQEIQQIIMILFTFPALMNHLPVDSNLIDEPPSYITLTYVKGLSETLKGLLSSKFPFIPLHFNIRILLRKSYLMTQ